MHEHESHCKVWDWRAGERTLNNALPCTCGFRTQAAEEQAQIRRNSRPLKPLGMSEEDWLRTNGIKP